MAIRQTSDIVTNEPNKMNGLNAKMSSSQPQAFKKANSGAPNSNSLMSSGPQPSTSISSAGYNNMIRGIGRDSNSMHSAKAGGNLNSQQATNQAYQLAQSNG